MVYSIKMLGITTKTVKYNQKVVISEGVEHAACHTCPAGRNGGFCQHVFAFLLVLEKYCQEYMYLIQGQLPIAGIEWCDLMVWLGFLPEQMHIQRISYNSIFWEQHMLPTLHSFYDIIKYSLKILQYY